MDDIESIFWVIVVVAVVARYFITTHRFAELRRVLDQQARDIAALKRALDETRPRAASAAPDEVAPVLPPAVEHEHIPVTPPQETLSPPLSPPAEPARERIKPRAIEQQFGGRAFVWVGGVALALAGFYLVKYSIDTGLLTEQVRVILGILFGLALLAGSYFVRSNPRIANGSRIGQALAGAGIADLYGSLFAATTLYHLVPPWLGFGAMAITTAVALVLSLRHGAAIALLGLIGGYATPAMINQGEPNAPLLFGYLYLVFAGLSGVSRGKNWWWLSIPASLVAFAWVVMWLTSAQASQDAAWLSTFLLAIGATAVIATPRRPEKEAVDMAEPRTWARLLAPAGAVVLAGAVAYTTNFGMFEWAMFGLFSLGAIGLAWFDGRTYIAIPWLAMGVNLAMLAGCNAQPADLAVITAGFAFIFCTSGVVLLPRAYYPLSWAGLSATAATLYFLFAYDALDAPLRAALTDNTWLASNTVWGAIAFAAAAVMTASAARPFVLSRETVLRHRLQAIFAVATTGLISVGLAILLHEEYLSFAIAVQILAVSWIRTRVDVPALKYLAWVLTAQYALLLIPDVTQLLAEAVGGASGSQTWPLITSVLFRFALPAAMFAGASYILRNRDDDIFVSVLEAGAVALVAITLYRLLEAIFIGHAHDMTLVISSIFTSVVLALGIAVMYGGRVFNRWAVIWAGVVLIAVGLLRIILLDFLVFNPLWSHQTVGTLPLVNGLLLVFVLPAILLYATGSQFAHWKIPQFVPGVRIAAYVIAFVWLSLSVRQAFHGAYLDGTDIPAAEVYAYSAVWLAVGVALLFAAAIRKDMTMRIASLVVMLLTVGKVFLYDASQLTGLWRVVSFLGLGLSLLALSWFYSRFIFVTEQPEPAT